jgi:hypothetical protein
MEQETSQELLRGESHRFLLIAVRIILPAEGNLVTLESDEAVIADGHAMSVTGEISQHMMRTAEGWFGIDDPILTEQGAQEGAKGFLVLKRLESSREGKLAHLKSSL